MSPGTSERGWNQEPHASRSFIFNLSRPQPLSSLPQPYQLHFLLLQLDFCPLVRNVNPSDTKFISSQLCNPRDDRISLFWFQGMLSGINLLLQPGSHFHTCVHWKRPIIEGGEGGMLSRLNNYIYFVNFVKHCISLFQVGEFLPISRMILFF